MSSALSHAAFDLTAGSALMPLAPRIGVGGPLVNAYDPLITTPYAYVPSNAPVDLPGGFGLPGGTSTRDVGN